MQFTIYGVGSFANQTLPCFPECNNCAHTLLNDLEKLDDEMGRIKAQLDNATASASSQDRLKKLEKAVSDTKVICQCTIRLQKTSVEHLQSSRLYLVTKAKRDLTCPDAK